MRGGSGGSCKVRLRCGGGARPVSAGVWLRLAGVCRSDSKASAEGSDGCVCCCCCCDLQQVVAQGGVGAQGDDSWFRERQQTLTVHLF